MTDGSQYIDIVLFAMVAVFLGLRLRSVLGRRTGNEPPPPALGVDAPARPENVVDIDRRRPVVEVPPPSNGGDPVATGLARIGAADPTFSPQRFVAGAAAAFELVVRAFAEGDEGALRPLLSDEVLDNFLQAIRARRAAGEICLSKLVEIKGADIVEAEFDGRAARLSVRFVSIQAILVKDSEGNVVEGDPSHPSQIIDLWTFSRDVRSPNPNWILVGTRSLDE
jgi:predicted lipid-binding transport protein (Tim44 family)